MIKQYLGNKTTSMTEIHHLKLLIESAQYLNDLKEDNFVVALMNGKGNCDVTPQNLNELDQTAVDLAVDLNECYCSQEEYQQTIHNGSGEKDISFKFDDILHERDLLPDIGVNIDCLIKMYLTE